MNREDFIDPGTGEIRTNELMAAVDQLAEENAALDFKIRQAARSEVALRKELAKTHADDPRSAQIREVLEYWVAVCHKSSRTKIPLDGVRAQKVRSRLNQKFTVEDLKLAIDGAAAKPFVGPRGRVTTNDPGTRREDDLELILRDEKYVERFQGYAREARRQQEQTQPPTQAEMASRWETLGGGPQRRAELAEQARQIEEKFPSRHLALVPAQPPAGYDPLRAVHDRAEEMGLEPRGEVWRFRAACPSHDDEERSLLVVEGVDDRAILFCARYCLPDEIAKAMGLRFGALFPRGHRFFDERATREIERGAA